jgi:phosphocarrier protein HPr
VEHCHLSILNALGLHARAAAKFVHTAGRFSAHIRVARGDREVDGKSIMGLLLLAAAQGSTIRITADGSDERDAISALCALVERGFDEAPAEPGQARPSCD